MRTITKLRVRYQTISNWCYQINPRYLSSSVDENDVVPREKMFYDAVVVGAGNVKSL